jgi:hypothetical protein
MKTIKLRGPSGCDEANLGGRIFRPRDDGFFYIDADLDITPLMHVGGFCRADDSPIPPVVAKRPTTLDDVMALARTHPEGNLKARLLAALVAVATSEPRQTVKVRPPLGTTSFFHGDRRYEIGEDGLIDAPLDCLDSICDGPGGFAVVADDPPSVLAADETPADDEVQSDDAEPAPVEAIESAADNPPAAEIDDAPPVAPSFHRLVIPAIPSVSLAAAEG